jgi:rhodanese-related sulfurtransferase
MATLRVSPQEALELMRAKGYAYLDVRSVPEFEAGHPEGAYNVPLLHMGPGGARPNSGFVAAVERRFPKDAALVVGCKTAGRSTQAVSILEQAGFTNLALQQSGFVGSSPADRGWGPSGLPTSRTAEPGRSWRELEADAP